MVNGGLLFWPFIVPITAYDGSLNLNKRTIALLIHLILESIVRESRSRYLLILHIMAASHSDKNILGRAPVFCNQWQWSFLSTSITKYHRFHIDPII